MIRRSLFQVVLSAAVCVVLAGWSYGQSGTTTPQSKSGADSFLIRAMEMNAAEIEFGRVAQTKAQNQQVKDFANMMVEDHTKALEQLHQVATGNPPSTAHQPGTTPGIGMQPGQMQLSKDQQQTLRRLSGLSGMAFDKEYMNVMVRSHQNAIREFEKEAGTAKGTTSTTGRDKPGTSSTTTTQPGDHDMSDNDLPTVAKEMLPALRSHLQQAQTIQRELQNKK